MLMVQTVANDVGGLIIPPSPSVYQIYVAGRPKKPNTKRL